MPSGRDKNPTDSSAEGERNVAGWRGNAMDLRLGPDDLDLLDNVLTVVPILRIVAAIGQEARKRGLKYPVSAAGDLVSHLGDKPLRLGEHRVDKQTIVHAMAESWFPIAHEGELLSRVHLALIRCEREAEQMGPRPALQIQ